MKTSLVPEVGKKYRWTAPRLKHLPPFVVMLVESGRLWYRYVDQDKDVSMGMETWTDEGESVPVVEFSEIPSPQMTTADGEEFCGWNQEPSRAVIAMSEGEEGCVLWWVGAALYYEISDAGMKTPADLGLHDAPTGISIWEGHYRSVQCGNPMDGYDYESEPVGKFREPTDEEWAAIRKGEAPWDEKDWWVTKEQEKQTP